MSEVLAGRYRLGAVLGVGGMARVVRAFDATLKREVAPLRRVVSRSWQLPGGSSLRAVSRELADQGQASINPHVAATLLRSLVSPSTMAG